MKDKVSSDFGIFDQIDNYEEDPFLAYYDLLPLLRCFKGTVL